MSSRYVSRAAQEAEQALRDIQSRLEGNQFCADCGTTRPEYINLTIGTFICELCADIHRTSSNRRIKDMYAGDITMEDVRRMDAVGNDVANRKFLATWNPHEVPEPNRRDRESLHEFLWLKYEGSFKKVPTPSPPTSHRQSDGDRYYDNRRDDRSADRDTTYRREQQLFRDPQPAQDRSRPYWSTRFGEFARQPQPPPTRHDDYYRRGEGSAQPLPDRYRSTAPSERFRPPQPAPLAPYDLARSARARYPEPYDDYASGRSYERDRRYASDLSTRYESPEPAEYSDDSDTDRTPRKKKSSKSKRKSKGASGKRDGDDYYYEDEEDEEIISERRPKKTQSSRSKKKSSKDSRKASRAKKRTQEESEEETPTTSSYDSEDEYEPPMLEKKKSKRKGKSEKRSEREVDSVKSLEDDAVPPTPAQNAKGEFDLMSDWMGDSKDTEGSQGVPPAVTAGTPTPPSVPLAMHQAYQTAHMPMMPQVPLSMYNSVMPIPGGGFMPIMPPGFVPGLPMQGMPGMPPVMPAAVGGMQRSPQVPSPGVPSPGVPSPGVPGTNTTGIPGLVNGIHNVSLNQTPVSSGQGTTPPPPPPVGVPAGPPPGPPPDPPQE